MTSIAFESEEGAATVGVMAEGEYEFGTSSKEVMKVISGQLDVKLPGSEQWVAFHAGEQFEVAKDQRFGVRSVGQSAYLCLYK